MDNISKYKVQMYNIDFYAKSNAFKILAFIIDSCNYKCEYCYNELPRTFTTLDLNKLYFFIKNIIIEKLHKQYIQLELIGGEPTLHPDLLSFCEKISALNNINITIYTNFSKDIQYYLKLLEINNKIQLILSWHTANKDFLKKLALLPKNIIENNITVSVIYEHNNIDEALKIFDYVSNKYQNIKELSFPLIDNNINYVREYTNDNLCEYKKRLNKVKDKTHIKIEYNNSTSEIVDQHYFIVDEATRNFNKWICNVGIDFCFIYFNGDICPCDGYRNIKLGNLYSDNLIDFKLNTKPIFCRNTCCPCVFDVKKKLVFKHK